MLIFSRDALSTCLFPDTWRPGYAQNLEIVLNADTRSCGLRFSDDVLRLAAMDVEAKADG